MNKVVAQVELFQERKVLQSKHILSMRQKNRSGIVDQDKQGSSLSISVLYYIVKKRNTIPRPHTSLSSRCPNEMKTGGSRLLVHHGVGIYWESVR